jgi:hypothetical protein
VLFTEKKQPSHAIYELLLIFYILVLFYDAVASPLKIHIMKKNTAIIIYFKIYYLIKHILWSAKYEPNIEDK